MAVFDGKIKVGTRISLEGDDFAPEMGALVGSSYTEDVLNHGTLNQVVQGNVTRTFLGNETITLMGDQTWTIMGNQTFCLQGNHSGTINGNCTIAILGLLVETLVAGQNTLCLGPYNRTDIGPVTWQCSSSIQLNFPKEWFESKWYQCSAIFSNFTALGIDLALKHHNIDFTIHNVNTEGICTKIKNLENALVTGLKNTAKAALIAVAMARSDINGIHPEVRAARPAVGVETSAPPSSLPGAQ